MGSSFSKHSSLCRNSFSSLDKLFTSSLISSILWSLNSYLLAQSQGSKLFLWTSSALFFTSVRQYCCQESFQLGCVQKYFFGPPRLIFFLLWPFFVLTNLVFVPMWIPSCTLCFSVLAFKIGSIHTFQMTAVANYL